MNKSCLKYTLTTIILYITIHNSPRQVNEVEAISSIKIEIVFKNKIMYLQIIII